jgi:hypothetical protein
MPKVLIIILAVLVFIFCIWAVLSFAARRLVDRRLERIESAYNLQISYGSVSLIGFSGISLNDVTFVPARSSIRFSARSFKIYTNFIKPSEQGYEIKSFNVIDMQVYLSAGSSSGMESGGGSGSPNYANMVRELFDGLSGVFPNLPPEVSIQGLRLIYNSRGDLASDYYIPSVRISNYGFVARMQNESRASESWICKGSYNPRASKLSLQMYSDNNSQIQLPILKQQLNATVRLDTLALNLQRITVGNAKQTIVGKIGVKGLSIEQPSLHSEPIFFDQGFAGFRINVGKNYIEVDSTGTNVRYKRLQFNPYILLVKNKDWRIRASLNKPYFPASDFFSSLPAGLFNTIDGMKVSGMVSYHLLFDVDLANIDNLVFESSAQAKNFKILSYGKTDISLMSDPFIHKVFDGGKKVREMEVGPASANFTPIGKLPKNLVQAVLVAEDYSFYTHKGFYDEAFVRSWKENLKARQFIRGASTLSMQVVKNVFLGHSKLISRKLEEIMIVWLIENNKLTSKSRMMEVYLNIIEWGPNVYGITEASRYYFIKEPSALTLSECIFLAYIIPSPKKLKSNFNGMRPKMQYYEFFDDTIKRMKRRRVISSYEASRADANVNFRGAVLNHLDQK